MLVLGKVLPTRIITSLRFKVSLILLQLRKISFIFSDRNFSPVSMLDIIINKSRYQILFLGRGLSNRVNPSTKIKLSRDIQFIQQSSVSVSCSSFFSLKRDLFIK